MIFLSDVIDVANEPKHINGIKGMSFLEWLRPRLTEAGCVVNALDYEDWGWFIEVRRGLTKYVVGASARPDREGFTEWSIHVRRARSFWEWITRGGRISRDDKLVQHLEQLIRIECNPQEFMLETDAGVPLKNRDALKRDR